MERNPLLELQAFGQSVWLDFLSRGMLNDGSLQRLIDQDGLRGVTSNPAIFEEAIDKSDSYESAIDLLAQEGSSALEIYETLAVEDVTRAADLFRPLYDSLGGTDGFVSLEVSPRLAHDTIETIAEAHRLWNAVNRPNIFIKVPGTKAGLPAISQLLAEGINVNVTLLFGLPRYREVLEAFLVGLETRLAGGEPIDHVSSVASFFLSRIDVKADPLLSGIAQSGQANAEHADALTGEVAIACAKIAYEIYEEFVRGERFRRLSVRGLRPQRVLWASTGTKNPAYSDVKYVEPLIGADTVNTMPLKTIEAYRDHGNPAPRLLEGRETAHGVLERLAETGLSIDELTQQLEDEGVEKFSKPFDHLLQMLEQERSAALEA